MLKSALIYRCILISLNQKHDLESEITQKLSDKKNTKKILLQQQKEAAFKCSTIFQIFIINQMNKNLEDQFFQRMDKTFELLIHSCSKSEERWQINFAYCEFYEKLINIFKQSQQNPDQKKYLKIVNSNKDPTFRIRGFSQENQKQNCQSGNNVTKQRILQRQMLRVMVDNPEGLQKKALFLKTRQDFGYNQKSDYAKRCTEAFGSLLESKFIIRKNNTNIYVANYINIHTCQPVIAERIKKNKNPNLIQIPDQNIFKIKDNQNKGKREYKIIQQCQTLERRPEKKRKIDEECTLE